MENTSSVDAQDPQGEVQCVWVQKQAQPCRECWENLWKGMHAGMDRALGSKGAMQNFWTLLSGHGFQCVTLASI